jgi:methylmalonyl-CoA mutase C-terminal domain/subunit
MEKERIIRAVVAKPGLDGHDRGAKVIVNALRDAGIEVIYTGLHQTPEMIATICQQEDPDVLLMSMLSGSHRSIVPKVIDELARGGLEDLPVLVGGIIPSEDIAFLEASGVSCVMGPGTETETIHNKVRELTVTYRSN